MRSVKSAKREREREKEKQKEREGSKGQKVNKHQIKNPKRQSAREQLIAADFDAGGAPKRVGSYICMYVRVRICDHVSGDLGYTGGGFLFLPLRVREP